MVFAPLHAAANLCFMPGLIFSLAAGAVFGIWVRFAAVLFGSIAGAGPAFLTARCIARAKIQRVAESEARFALQNLLVRVDPHLLLASWVAMIPGTLLTSISGMSPGRLRSLASAPSVNGVCWRWDCWR